MGMFADPVIGKASLSTAQQNWNHFHLHGMECHSNLSEAKSNLSVLFCSELRSQL